MRKLQRFLIIVIILGIVIAAVVPESIYIYWFANIQKQQVKELFVKDSYNNIEWIFDDLWNAEVYVESFANALKQEDLSAAEFSDPSYVDAYMDDLEKLSEQLLYGIDFFYGVEFYVNPALSGSPKGIYRQQQNGDVRKSIDMETARIHYDKMWEHADEAEEGLWIEPYYSQEDRTRLIAYVQSVYAEDGTILGIVGAAYNYNLITSTTQNLSYNKREHYMLCDREGNPLTMNDFPQVSEADWSDILALESEDYTFSCRTDQGRYTIYAYQLLNGDYVISYIRDWELYREHYRILLVVIAISFVITIFFAIVITRVIRRAFQRVQHDNLTSAWNRNAYMDVVQEITDTLHSPKKKSFTIVVFDINGLKRENDMHGHHAGDRMIQNAYGLIKGIFPKECIYRIGGDEFSIIYHDSQREKLLGSIDRFYQRMDEYMNAYETDKGVILISAGYATFDEQQDNCYEDTFNRADAMMYARKKAFYDKYPELRRK